MLRDITITNFTIQKLTDVLTFKTQNKNNQNFVFTMLLMQNQCSKLVVAQNFPTLKLIKQLQIIEYLDVRQGHEVLGDVNNKLVHESRSNVKSIHAIFQVTKTDMMIITNTKSETVSFFHTKKKN